MKKLSLYIFLFLLTLTTISKAEVFIKCDHISGSFDKKILKNPRCFNSSGVFFISNLDEQLDEC